MVRAQAFVLVLTVLSGCSKSPRIVVGSKNFTESVLLGEIVSQHIERKLGIQVDRKLNLGGTLLAHEAIKSGSIEIYPEYTGTALTAVLKRPPARDPAAVFEEIRRAYREQWRIEWLGPLGFNNTFAILVRTRDARELDLRTIDDLRRVERRWTPGFGHEFLQRQDGYPGLVRTYGLNFASRPRAMELSLIYPALAGGQVDVIAGDATSAMIDALQLTALEDNRHYFPPYDAIPVVRTAALRRHPAIASAIARLTGKISNREMRGMNAAVDVRHEDPRQVVREFLARLPRRGE